MLIQPKHIPTRVPKRRRYFRRMRPHSLNNRPAILLHQLHRHLDVIHHNVQRQPIPSEWRPVLYPCSAHFSHAIIKPHTAIPACSHTPSKHTSIKLR